MCTDNHDDRREPAVEEVAPEMRKMLFAAFASTMLLALALPAGAFAHRAHHRSARHTARHRHKHAAIRVLDFHAAAAPGAPSTPAGTGTQPTTPQGPEKAGTVASFTGGVLTIKLNDNSLVSGKVTEETEIHCTSASGSGGEGDQGDASPVRAHESWAHAADEQSEAGTDTDDQPGEGEQSNCPANPLGEGIPVLDAELELGPAGAVWKHVDLLE
jgi:hypothetical protein